MKTLALTTLAALSTARGQAPAEPAELPLDRTRVAIQLEARDLPLDLAALAAEAGAGYRDHRRHGSLHRLIELDRALDDAAVEAVVAALARRPGVRFATHVRRDRNGEACYPTPGILVRFRADVPEAAQRGELEGLPLEGLEPRLAGVPRAWRLATSVRTGAEVEALAAQLAASPAVEWVVPDRMVTLRYADCPASDPLFGGQWALKNTGQEGGTAGMDLNAAEAWCIGTGDPFNWVVVIDSGVEKTHADMDFGIGTDETSDAGNGGGPVNACDVHGTTVASTFAANNNSQLVAGLAPAVPALSARVAISEQGGDGSCTGSATALESWIANGIGWAQFVGARATVSSFEFQVWLPMVFDAYDVSRQAGLLHFVAAGNSGSGSLPPPASYVNTLAVGAMDRHGNRASFSNWGSGLFCLAPGEDLDLLDRTGAAGFTPNDYALGRSGTSYAAPYAAGVAALMFGIRPNNTGDDVEEMLRQTCRDLGAGGWDQHTGWGLPDAFAAIDLAGDVWADAAQTGSGAGTITLPYRTLVSAAGAVPDGQSIRAQAGSYPDPVVFDGAYELVATGGSVVIGQ